MNVILSKVRALPSVQVTLSVALLLLGFLIAAQVAAEGPRVRYSTEERTPLIETALGLQSQQEALKGEILALRQEIGTLEEQGSGDADELRRLYAQLEEARIAAGLIAVAGSGVAFRFEDGTAGVDGLVTARDVRVLIQEVWLAGAEGVAVNGERIVGTSAILDIGGSILVNSAYLAPPYTVTAIGPPDLYARMLASASFVQFVQGRIEPSGIALSVAEQPSVDLPPFAGTVNVRYAAPAEEGAGMTAPTDPTDPTDPTAPTHPTEPTAPTEPTTRIAPRVRVRARSAAGARSAGASGPGVPPPPVLHAQRAIGPGSRLTVALVAALLGLLVIGQLRGQANVPGLSALSATELTQLIANLSAGNDLLREEVALLAQREEAMQAAQDRGETTVDDLAEDLAAIRAWSGLTAVAGQGIAVTVHGSIGGDGIDDLLNEIRNAGAEAISIDGVRIVSGVVVAGAPGALSVGNQALREAFEIRAIGSPQILTGTLTRTGGVIAQIGATYPLVTITVTPVERLTLPATDRTLTPTYAEPRL